MSVRAEAIRDDVPSVEPVGSATPSLGDMYFFVMPMDTYQALSAAASKKGMSFAVAMKVAINDFLKKE